MNDEYFLRNLVNELYTMLKIMQVFFLDYLDFSYDCPRFMSVLRPSHKGGGDRVKDLGSREVLKIVEQRVIYMPFE